MNDGPGALERVLAGIAGRAAPDSVQGWFEQGGSVAIQRALMLDDDALRRVRDMISGWDERVRVDPDPNQVVHIAAVHPGDSLQGLILDELPIWLIESALLFALACRARGARVHLAGQMAWQREMLASSLSRMNKLGISGEAGWAGGVTVCLTKTGTPAGALPVLLALRLPFVILSGDAGGPLPLPHSAGIADV